jgi:hypothetical protein
LRLAASSSPAAPGCCAAEEERAQPLSARVPALAGWMAVASRSGRVQARASMIGQAQKPEQGQVRGLALWLGYAQRSG